MSFSISFLSKLRLRPEPSSVEMQPMGRLPAAAPAEKKFIELSDDEKKQVGVYLVKALYAILRRDLLPKEPVFIESVVELRGAIQPKISLFSKNSYDETKIINLFQSFFKGRKDLLPPIFEDFSDEELNFLNKEFPKFKAIAASSLQEKFKNFAVLSHAEKNSNNYNKTIKIKREDKDKLVYICQKKKLFDVAGELERGDLIKEYGKDLFKDLIKDEIGAILINWLDLVPVSKTSEVYETSEIYEIYLADLLREIYLKNYPEIFQEKIYKHCLSILKNAKEKPSQLIRDLDKIKAYFPELITDNFIKNIYQECLKDLEKTYDIIYYIILKYPLKNIEINFKTIIFIYEKKKYIELFFLLNLSKIMNAEKKIEFILRIAKSDESHAHGHWSFRFIASYLNIKPTELSFEKCKEISLLYLKKHKKHQKNDQKNLYYSFSDFLSTLAFMSQHTGFIAFIHDYLSQEKDSEALITSLQFLNNNSSRYDLFIAIKGEKFISIIENISEDVILRLLQPFCKMSVRESFWYNDLLTFILDKRGDTLTQSTLQWFLKFAIEREHNNFIERSERLVQLSQNFIQILVVKYSEKIGVDALQSACDLLRSYYKNEHPLISVLSNAMDEMANPDTTKVRPIF